MDRRFDMPELKGNEQDQDRDQWSDLAAQAYDRNQPAAKAEPVVCTGTFAGPPPDAAFRLSPPQIGLRGGFVLFNQNCDDDRIKQLPGFKPHNA